jgi:replicative DNA helicase
MTEIPIPIATDTERLILGAVLLDGSLMEALRSTIEPDDFGTHTHRLIWRAICAVLRRGQCRGLRFDMPRAD